MTWPFIDPDAILEVEAAGRAELIAGAYKVGFIALPADLRDDGAAFEEIGFEFGEVIEGDIGVDGNPLWRLTKLPDGWRLEPEEGPYSYWTLLLDDTGATRGRIFYKAAPYDRRAFMRLEEA